MAKPTQTLSSVEIIERDNGGIKVDVDKFTALWTYIQNVGKTREDVRTALEVVGPFARTLSDEDRDDLRERCRQLLESFQNRLQPQALHNRPLTVVRPAKLMDTRHGETFLLTIVFLDDEKEVEYTCFLPGSSKGQTFRFFSRVDRTQYPLRVVFEKKPHQYKDEKTGQMMDGNIWSVERIPDPVATYSEIPF